MSSCQLLVYNHRDTSNHKNQECCDSCVDRNEPLTYIRLYLRDKKINKSPLQNSIGKLKVMESISSK